MNRWQQRERKLRKRRYGMRVDGANVRKLMLDLLNRNQRLDSHEIMDKTAERESK